MAIRIKGQETEVIILVGGKARATITAIRNFSVDFEMKLLDEGYLGMTTNLKDDIFNGIKGSLEMHLESGDVFDLIAQIVDRARRRSGLIQVNIKSSFQFPGGQRRRLVIPDCYFDAIPLNIGSRQDYVNVKLSFGASSAQFIS